MPETIAGKGELPNPFEWYIRSGAGPLPDRAPGAAGSLGLYRNGALFLSPVSHLSVGRIREVVLRRVLG